MEIQYRWRGEFTNQALNGMHAEGFQHESFDDDWWSQVNDHSLGWVCAYTGEDLVGFVNVAWDGAFHAFILDTLVARPMQRLGVGVQLVAIATANTRLAGCEWLHVDYEAEHRSFYEEACGFAPTSAGLINL